jgi:glycine dehydrogenase subunit 1
MKELSWQNLQKARYAQDRITRIDGITSRFQGVSFNEFVLEFEKPWADIEGFLLENGIVGGLSITKAYPELANCVLICVTESHKKEDIDRFVGHLEEACR